MWWRNLSMIRLSRGMRRQWFLFNFKRDATNTVVASFLSVVKHWRWIKRYTRQNWVLFLFKPRIKYGQWTNRASESYKRTCDITTGKGQSIGCVIRCGRDKFRRCVTPDKSCSAAASRDDFERVVLFAAVYVCTCVCVFLQRRIGSVGGASRSRDINVDHPFKLYSVSGASPRWAVVAPTCRSLR